MFYGLFARGLQRQLKFKAGLDNPLKLARTHFATESRIPRAGPLAGAGEEGGHHPQYSQTFLGRRRYLPGIRSQDWGKKSYAERCALNTPIQGTAADILKLALSGLIAGLPERPWLKPLLQIHDELVFELPADSLHEAVAFILSRMEAQPFLEFDVPIIAEAAYGSDFGHMAEME